MIPRHRPPYGLAAYLAAHCKPLNSLEACEESVADVLGVPHAILLPSARFGIMAGLQVALEGPGEVATPTLTCGVVHAAVLRSGCRPAYQDSRWGSFLMDPGLLSAGPVVLSEAFGHTYEPAELNPRLLRIWDMAMTSPTPALAARVQGSDLGLFSFGLGKVLFAGWGGLAITQDESLAAELRKHLAKVVQSPIRRWEPCRSFMGALRIAAHWEWLYSHVRGASDRKCSMRGPDARNGEPEGLKGGLEWSLMPSRTEAGIICRGFLDGPKMAELRIKQEGWYRAALDGVRGVILPAKAQGALSHFTIRVAPSQRQALRSRLWAAGIDTGTLFPFAPYLDPGNYPNTFLATQELINLPLGHSLLQSSVSKVRESIQGVFGLDPDYLENGRELP